MRLDVVMGSLVLLSVAVACLAEVTCSRGSPGGAGAALAGKPPVAPASDAALAGKPPVAPVEPGAGVVPGAGPGAGPGGETRVTLDGHTVTAPAGQRVRMSVETAGEDSEISTKGEASGDHPITSADAKRAASDAGKTDWAALVDLAKATSDPKFTGLVILGGLLVVAGCVAGIWLGQASLGLALGAGGAALVALGVVAETSPWLIAVGLVGGVIAVGLVWWHARGAKGHALVARTLTEAVETHDPDGTSGLKNTVARVANRTGALERVKAAVRRVKRSLGIPADRATAARVNGLVSNTGGGTGQGGPPPPA